MVNARRAFTLIEMLVVLAIILVLAGLLLVTYQPLRRMQARSRTSAILSVLMKGMQQGGAETAKNVAPVEHPLCGSAAPRARFVSAGGAELDRDGEALRVVDPAHAPGARPRVIADDDLFADDDAPQFHGVPRARLRVLGVASTLVTRYRDLPDPAPAATLRAPYGPAQYPDERHLVAPRLVEFTDDGFREVELDPRTEAWERAGDKLMALALQSAENELADLGAIHRVDPERDPLIAKDRVRRDARPGVVATRDRWEPGRVRDGASWARYRLRGPAIYDAWGVEVLCSIGAGGALRLESAGVDGSFRIHPGPDSAVATQPGADAPAGDDRDGVADNIVLGGKR